MKAIEIKEKRKKLGLTQKEFAKLVGVSTQTINGYENGKEIPSTKHQILDKILNQTLDINTLNEPPEKYEVVSGFDKNIIETIDEINKKQTELSNYEENSTSYLMTIEVITLLKEKIELIKNAKKNHFKQ
jgi:transcriptional regulator with XRE-family HTH domain